MSQERVVKKLHFGKGKLLIINEKVPLKYFIHNSNLALGNRYIKYLEADEEIEIKNLSDLVFLAKAKNIDLTEFISSHIYKFSKFISLGFRLGMIISDGQPYCDPKSKYFINLKDFGPNIIDNHLCFITLNKENSKAIIAKYNINLEDLSYKKETISTFDIDLE
jgi:hypothetical protein